MGMEEESRVAVGWESVAIGGPSVFSGTVACPLFLIQKFPALSLRLNSWPSLVEPTISVTTPMTPRVS